MLSLLVTLELTDSLDMRSIFVFASFLVQLWIGAVLAQCDSSSVENYLLEFNYCLEGNGYPQEIGFAILDVETGDTLLIVGVFEDLDFEVDFGYPWYLEVQDYPFQVELAGGHDYMLLAGDAYGDGWNGQEIFLSRQGDSALVEGFENGYTLTLGFGIDTLQFSALEPSCEGCTDSLAVNYNSTATIENGGCLFTGCTDNSAMNYDVNASIDDSSCFGCIDESLGTYIDEAGVEHCSPIPIMASTDTVCWTIESPVLARWNAPVGFNLSFKLIQSVDAGLLFGSDMELRFYNSLNPFDGQMIFSCLGDCSAELGTSVLSETGELSVVVVGTDIIGTCYEPDDWYSCGPDFWASGSNLIVELEAVGPQICGVTVDSELNYLTWDLGLDPLIDSIVVWKLSDNSSVWDELEVLDVEVSSYYDSESNPNVQPESYRLSVQTSNPEFSWGVSHTTSLLQSNLGINGEVNLYWSDYEGVEVLTYRVWRREGGEWFPISDVSGSTQTYVDLLPPSVIDLAYRIEIISEDFCSADSENQLPFIGTNTTFIDQELLSISDFRSDWITVNLELDKVSWSSTSNGVFSEIHDLRGNVVYFDDYSDEANCIHFSELGLPAEMYLLSLKCYESGKVYTLKFVCP
jgi:hypothetical protein